MALSAYLLVNNADVEAALPLNLKNFDFEWERISMYSSEKDLPSAWIKPVAKPSKESLKTRINTLRAELREAEAQLREIEEGERLEALVKVRNLMRGFQLTPADLGLEPTVRHRGRPRKITP